MFQISALEFCSLSAQFFQRHHRCQHQRQTNSQIPKLTPLPSHPGDACKRSLKLKVLLGSAGEGAASPSCSPLTGFYFFAFLCPAPLPGLVAAQKKELLLKVAVHLQKQHELLLACRRHRLLTNRHRQQQLLSKPHRLSLQGPSHLPSRLPPSPIPWPTLS